MSKIGTAIYEIHHMDTIASREQWVNQIHPLVKLVLTIGYIAVTVSFHKYNLVGLIGMLVYPLSMFLLADLSIKDSIKRLRIVLPLVCFVGIWNPFFDHTFVFLGDVCIRGGVVSMLTLMIKGLFSVLASYLLIATTSIEKICYALRLLRVPKLVVTQILLTYRYITLLLGEVNQMTQAYALRAPNQKGIHCKAWGSLTGQLLLRSVDRANEVYESMLLRGYQGEFGYLGPQIKMRKKDWLFFLFWSSCIIFVRMVPIVTIIGNFVGGH